MWASSRCAIIEVQGMRESRMDTYKIDILLGLVRDELRSIRRGEVSRGTTEDNQDYAEDLAEIQAELEARK